MKILKNSWAILFCMALTATLVEANPRIDFSLTKTGFVDANVVVPNATLTNGLPQKNGKSYGLALLLVPFEQNNNWIVSKAQDVSVASIASNKGYSLLAVTFPPSKTDDLEINLEKALKLGENREGKSKFNLNFDYPYLTQTQREILDLDFSHTQWDIGITLLSKYEDDEVSKSSGSINRLSDKEYQIVRAAIASLPKKDIWLVFPNSQQKALDIAKLILSLLIGLITALFQTSVIKDRKLSTVLLIFTLTSLVIGLSVYYALVLSKGFELAV